MKIHHLAAAALLGPSLPAHAQSQWQNGTWYGRESASTAEPIRTVTPRAQPQERGRPVEGRRWGWRPQRSIYLDPVGNVTVWVGDAPYWMRTYQRPEPYVRPQYAYPSGGYGQRAGAVSSPACSPSSGPATADAAIAAAPGAFRSGC